ncbi:MAG: mechanosensitive ion channel family protein, partial [Campylobacter lanienae]|nr:mechanosensitive ion channel family protein [Campylobacter lanienae]
MSKIIKILLFLALSLMAEESQISILNENINRLDATLKGNIWLIKYANYNTYQNLLLELEQAQNQLKNGKFEQNKDELNSRVSSLKEQIELLKEYEKSPFQSMLAVPDVEEEYKITNPIAIIGGFSYLKRLKGQKSEYYSRLAQLEVAVDILSKKQNLLQELYDLNKTAANYANLVEINRTLSEFNIAKEIATTTFG